MVKSWDYSLIGDIFDFKNGLNKSKEFFGHGTPIVNYSDVYKKRSLSKADIKGKVSLSTDEIKRFEVKKADVFFTRTSETPDEVGISCVLLDEVDECVFSGFVLRARPRSNILLPEYCKYCFSTPEIRSAIILGCTYTTRALTNGKQLSAISISVPPLSEQKHIAEALSDVDELISSLEKLIEKYKSIKSACLQQMFPQNGETTPKMRLPGFTDAWEQRKLGEISTITKGQQINKAKLGASGVYYVLNGGMTPSGYTDSFNTEKGTISISEGGNSCGFVNYNYEPFWSGGHNYTLQNPKICVDYLYQVLKYIEPSIMALRVGSGLPNVQKSRLSDVNIVFPSKEEQHLLGAYFKNLDNLITLHQRKLQKAQKIKRGMMQQLLTGKIRLVEKETITDITAEHDNLPETQIGHNHQFDDAVMIAAIVNSFYSEKYPLGRKKVQKLLYLLRRKQEADTSEFKKKAAGPYADEIRYKGGEPIAKKNGYISATTTPKGTSFSKGQKIDAALSYVEKWQMQSDIDWLVSNFKYVGVNDLELYATIDMAICDLRNEGVEISVDSVKELIRSNSEWKAKLKKAYFSDADIARAINMSYQLYS